MPVAVDTAVDGKDHRDRRKKKSCLHEVYILAGGDQNKQTNKNICQILISAIKKHKVIRVIGSIRGS